MRLEIGDLHQSLKTTMIYVTHDQVEAMTMADKIVVLNKGEVAQIGSPLVLYNHPQNLFVARFIGSPTMNIATGPSAAKRSATTIGIRPEHVDVSATAGEWPAKVRLAEHLGSDTYVHVEVDNIGPMTIRLGGEAPNQPGQRIFLTPQEPRIHRFDQQGLRIGQ
jgi:multiple sugar transport system ATP-binding protein